MVIKKGRYSCYRHSTLCQKRSLHGKFCETCKPEIIRQFRTMIYCLLIQVCLFITIQYNQIEHNAIFFYINYNFNEFKPILNNLLCYRSPHSFPQILPQLVLQTQVLWLSGCLDITVDMNKTLAYNIALLMNPKHRLHRKFHNIIGRPTHYRDYRLAHGMN